MNNSNVPQSRETIGIATQAFISEPSPSIDPALLQAFAQYGSPIVMLLLLIWLFKALTAFVKACR